MGQSGAADLMTVPGMPALCAYPTLVR